MAKNIVIFWSWQSDSSTKENKYFIEDCIKRAITKIEQSTAKIIEIDRDTKGKGGMPSIADTILNKIHQADIFIWDATLCYLKPKPSPNPNVLIELGYALSCLGDGRIIGVMNISNGLNGAHLPFDLKHRRWPITYSLMEPKKIEESKNQVLRHDAEFIKKKRNTKKELTSKLVDAIGTALMEPKSGVSKSNMVSIVGSWKMSVGTSIYGLNFTNYGILRATFLNGRQWSNLNYTFSESTLSLTMSPNTANTKIVIGRAIISTNGDTLTVSGFATPKNLHAEGVTAPIVNGIYIRQ